MHSKRTYRKVRIVALVLQFIFLFPLVYNPLHYLFVEHYHYNVTPTPSVEKYHKTCNIDDFNVGESADIKPVESEFLALHKQQLKPLEKVEIVLSEPTLGFLLRAPPCYRII